MEIKAALQAREEIVWLNEKKDSTVNDSKELSAAAVAEAEARLQRFAPVIEHYFPETQRTGGIIESPLKEVPQLKAKLNADYGANIRGRLFIKMDSNLAVAGSVKARGGIYEVLKHTEDLALAAGIISGTDDDYLKLTSEAARSFFRKQKMQVGSTGNLGLSIGIMSAALGYEAIIHMSADAKEWKKALLWQKGATVVEYAGDYGEAVKQGRLQSAADKSSYFVDDENSRDLFLGYATAGKRLESQLEAEGIAVGDDCPLFVYIPCGVGGAPGGITLGLRQIFGRNVHCFFAEPQESPCMLLGMATGLGNSISVQDVGLTGKTQADGLACGRASGLSCRVMANELAGIFTVRDGELTDYLHTLWRSEEIFIEPSSCAAIKGAVQIGTNDICQKYLVQNGLAEKIDKAVHIIWATGGSFVPQEIRDELLA